MQMKVSSKLPSGFAENDSVIRNHNKVILLLLLLLIIIIIIISWLQARLPIKDGGLGVRRVSSLALPAFLASAAGIALLQAEILADCNVSEDPYRKDYLQLWSESGN